MSTLKTQSVEAQGSIPDWLELQERLGSPEDAAPLCAALLASGGVVKTRAGFKEFLTRHSREALLPLELPIIEQAFEHAAAGRARELIAFDASLASKMNPTPLAEASKRVGRIQLRRMKAMKSQRCIARYAEAVDCGAAFGWHSVVYGVVMAAFSLPLRDGLTHYARQTARGFILAAAEDLRLTIPECREFEEAALAPALPAIETLVKSRFGSKLKIV